MLPGTLAESTRGVSSSGIELGAGKSQNGGWGHGSSPGGVSTHQGALVPRILTSASCGAFWLFLLLTCLGAWGSENMGLGWKASGRGWLSSSGLSTMGTIAGGREARGGEKGAPEDLRSCDHQRLIPGQSSPDPTLLGEGGLTFTLLDPAEPRPSAPEWCLCPFSLPS